MKQKQEILLTIGEKDKSGAYATIVYVISLRCPEGILIDLKGLNKHWPPKNEEYLIIALLGRVKGESFYWSHLLPSVQLTTLGVKV